MQMKEKERGCFDLYVMNKRKLTFINLVFSRADGIVYDNL